MNEPFYIIYSKDIKCGNLECPCGSHDISIINDNTYRCNVCKSKIKVIDTCKHKNLIIYEQIYGKTTYNKDCTNTYTDWSSNAINAHTIRVSKYMCLDCRVIINAPIYEDTQNE